jgi:microcystin-dependent protein
MWLSSDYEWPKVDAVQNGVFTGGDLSTGTFTNFYSLNDVSGTPGGQTALKYTNSHWTGSETWWATFTWRGNSSTSPFPPETRESLSNSIIAKRRTRTTITVPSLPAPIAGTGGARDPAKDVYGWRYYIGKGASDPTRTGRWRQTVQPSGEPTVVTTIALDTYPVFSGNNPPATNTMPGGGPSEFASTSGGFSVMGDGSGGWPLMVEAPPIGAINMYGGPSTSDPNSQWMVCDGRAISRTTYATLFARYSTFYGVGNGSTTFNIPNFSGKMPLGANGDGGSHPRGQTGGAETHTLSTTEMPSHSHGGVTGDDSPDHAHVQQLGGGISNVNNAAGGYVIGNANNSTTSGATARHQHGIGAQGGGGAHNNMPPFLGVNFIIRVL